jgi:hypothetical protein
MRKIESGLAYSRLPTWPDRQSAYAAAQALKRAIGLQCQPETVRLAKQ